MVRFPRIVGWSRWPATILGIVRRSFGAAPAEDIGFDPSDGLPPWPLLSHSAESLHKGFAADVVHLRPIEAKALRLTRPIRLASAADEARHLLTAGYSPRPNLAPFPITLPLDWSADPHHDRNWRVQLNMLRMLDPLIRAHEQSDPDAASDWLRSALSISLDWHRYHIAEGRQHAHAWIDMMTGVRTLRLAYLAQRMCHIAGASSNEVRAMAELLHEHWRQLTAPGFFRFTNHTIWDLHGLTALVRLCLRDDSPEFAQWQQAIALRLDRLIDLQFDEHGIHRENSPQYHFVASNMFRTLQESGWYADAPNKLARILSRAGAQDHWMRFPDGRYLPIGDSDGSAPRRPVRLPIPVSYEHTDAINTLNHSCYCFVRRASTSRPTTWSMLAIKAGFDLPGHRHHDELSYVWSESGCDIVVDPGKFSYDLNERRDYALSSRAHNLIEFGGRNSNPHGTHRTGHIVTDCRRETWGTLVVARIQHRPLEVHHERRYHFAPGRWLVIVDEFQARRAIDFTHWTHLAPEFEVMVDGHAIAAHHTAGGQLDIAQWSNVPLRISVEKGQPAPRIQGWVSRKYGQLQPSPALGLSGRARSAIVVAALSLEPQGRLTQAPVGSLTWTCGGATVVLRLREASLTCSGFFEPIIPGGRLGWGWVDVAA